MNEPDLTEAVEASARAAYEANAAPGARWDNLPGAYKHQYRTYVLPFITPAAQLIYAQGYRDAALDAGRLDLMPEGESA